MILSELAPVVGAQQAEFYMRDSSSVAPHLKLLASYASGGQSTHGKTVEFGEGLIGQVATDKQKVLLEVSLPSSIRVITGLSHSVPRNILVLPVVFEGEAKGVLELVPKMRKSWGPETVVPPPSRSPSLSQP